MDCECYLDALSNHPQLPHRIKNDKTVSQLLDNYRHSVDNGILKVMSKMGISTLQSY